MSIKNKNRLPSTDTDKRFKYLFIPFLIYFSFLLPNSIFSNDISPITVTVIDGDTNEELSFVTVFTADKKFNALTDIDGKVSIPDLGHRDIINFSYVGYITKKIPYFEFRRGEPVIKMYSENLILGVVVVGRTDAAEEELPFVIDRISAQQIASRNSQTTADVLGEHADVYIQKSQAGGGSPIIRGFEANKVLLVLDGIRLNNAIYRNGHLQNAITVDASMLEQIEVIYGPGSLMYGSEALGGVIHFRSREPKVSFSSTENLTDTRAYTRFSSANLEKTLHFDFEYGAKEWASLTSFTYSDFGDLKSGSKRPSEYPTFGRRPYYINTSGVDQVVEIGNPDIQKGGSYSQIDFLQKIKYQPKESLFFVANFQYSSSSNVPRYDNLQDTLDTADNLKWAEWYYGPQNRLMASLKMKAFAPKWLYNKATIIGSFQLLEEDRLKRKFRHDRRTFNLEDVFVYSFTADFDKELDQAGKNTISYGVDGNFNQVFSEAGDLNVETGEVRRKEFTRYPSDYSTLLSYAGYLNYRWKGLDSMLVFNIGARYTFTDLFAKYKESDRELIDWPTAYTEAGISSSNSALTYGAGLTFNTRNNWQVQLLASTAFRSPNIDDFAKLRVKSGQVVLPNTDLKPENSKSAEATLGKTVGSPRSTSLRLSATGFYTILEDVIVRQAGLAPNGDTILWIPSEGEFFDVQQNVNADDGSIYGGSANMLLKIGANWNLSSSLSYTKGRVNFKNSVIDTLVPMAHIPPIYGQTSLLYTKEKIRLEVVAKYNMKKPIDEYSVNKIANVDGVIEIDKGSTPDNAELGIAYTIDNQTIYEGTYAWATFNLYGAYAFNAKFSIDIAVENITDIHYRHFASGVSAPGRNFIVSFRGKF
ncbi:MAG: hemoglobin/transferrin/lactoferrin receptor protein [Polaribacter sp.]